MLQFILMFIAVFVAAFSTEYNIHTRTHTSTLKCIWFVRLISMESTNQCYNLNSNIDHIYGHSGWCFYLSSFSSYFSSTTFRYFDLFLAVNICHRLYERAHAKEQEQDRKREKKNFNNIHREIKLEIVYWNIFNKLLK